MTMLWIQIKLRLDLQWDFELNHEATPLHLMVICKSQMSVNAAALFQYSSPSWIKTCAGAQN